MVCEMMITHGAAKNWPIESDIFDGEKATAMEHIRAKGWLQDHTQGGVKKPPRPEEAEN